MMKKTSTAQEFFVANYLLLHPKIALAKMCERFPDTVIGSIYSWRTAARAKGQDVPAFPGGGGSAARLAEIEAGGGAPTAKPGPAGYGKKAALVLSQPADMPAAAIMAIAEKQGLSMSRSYIDKLRRARGKHANGKQVSLPGVSVIVAAEPAVKPARRKRGEMSAEDVPPLGRMSAEEADFMGSVIDIGYTRASRLLLQCRILLQKTLNNAVEGSE